MDKSNVQETSATTGTGSITLAGSSEDGRTFTSQYATNKRFTYYIDDRSGNFETGVGYLSASTILVRERPMDGSASLPVNFSAGTKQVYVGVNPSNLISSSLGYNSLGSGVKFMLPSNLVRLNSSFSLTANRQYFMEAPFLRGSFVDAMAINVNSGGGTSSNKMHIGLYEVNSLTGLAGNLLIEVNDLDPSSSGIVSGSFTEVFIPAGVYIISVWCDVSVSITANDGTIVGTSVMSSSSTLKAIGHNYTSGLTSLSSLPSPATTSDNNTNGKLMSIAIGHT